MELGVSVGTLHVFKTNKVLKRHTSCLKPSLNEDNKITRVQYALEEVNITSLTNNVYTFKDCYDRIHIDEKWFYMTRDQQGYYLGIGEEEPKRNVQHKGHITKVMFLCAQARPRFNTATNSWWDGKLGIWPIGHIAPAQRKSKHRAKGTPVWHNLSITKVVYRKLLIEKVLPAIHTKWPRLNTMTSPIRIQQDGATPHIVSDDPEFRAAVEALGLNLHLYTQPAQSPDLNILDLGFFRAIQSFNDATPSSEMELIASVEEAYNGYDYKKINHLFLTLQLVLNCIIECHGGNVNKIPHMNKRKLDRMGTLPKVLQVTEDASQHLG